MDQDDAGSDDEGGEDKTAVAAASAHAQGRRASQVSGRRADPLRPRLLDKGRCPREDGDDSFRCFHLLGFDVLLGQNGKPYLLEVSLCSSAALLVPF